MKADDHDDDYLSKAELFRITGKKRFKAQRRALAKMLIRHIVRADGRPVVARSLVEALLHGHPEPPPPVPAGRVNLSVYQGNRGRVKSTN